MHRKSWTLAFKLENDHAGIVTRGENVQAGMGGNHPKSVMFTPKSVQTSALGHVPNPDGFVFGVGHDEVLSGMENHAGDVVVVTPTSVHFPSLKKERKIETCNFTIR